MNLITSLFGDKLMGNIEDLSVACVTPVGHLSKGTLLHGLFLTLLSSVNSLLILRKGLEK